MRLIYLVPRLPTLRTESLQTTSLDKLIVDALRDLLVVQVAGNSMTVLGMVIHGGFVFNRRRYREMVTVGAFLIAVTASGAPSVT
jgi:hypothetical protein